ncbi:PDZ/DHR/GLGF domain protein, partial [Teladorsagia circumcincta]
CWTMSTRAALCAASLEEHMQRITSSNLSAQITPSTVSPSASQDEPKEVVGPRTSGGHAISSPASTAHDRPSSEIPPVTETATTTSPPASPPSSTRRTSAVVDESHSPTTSTMEESRREHPKSLPLDQLPSDSRRSSSTKARKPVPNGSAMRATSAHSPETPALTVFLRENWQNTNYETIDVKLLRDPALGLGITVAGYVHRKEEIGGIFVKSLVPRSAAALSGSIRVHDLILEVNGVSLEHLSHADSVRTLVRSGENVQLRLIRFPVDSAQAQCLKMLQEQ